MAAGAAGDHINPATRGADSYIVKMRVVAVSACLALLGGGCSSNSQRASTIDTTTRYVRRDVQFEKPISEVSSSNPQRP